MIRLFLYKARQQERSIVDLCEYLAVRRFVQKELIRTIFLIWDITIIILANYHPILKFDETKVGAEHGLHGFGIDVIDIVG